MHTEVVDKGADFMTSSKAKATKNDDRSTRKAKSHRFEQKHKKEARMKEKLFTIIIRKNNHAAHFPLAAIFGRSRRRYGRILLCFVRLPA